MTLGLGGSCHRFHTTDMPTIFSLILICLVLVGGTRPIQADQNDPRLPSLFALLEVATNVGEGFYAERIIWSIWTQHPDQEISALMRTGGEFLASRDYKNAHEVFGNVVERAPKFAEGWNKRATVRYLMGDHEGSVRDIKRTLALEPRHFGALSGLGLIYMAIERPESALKAFEKTLEIHPQFVGAQHHIEQIREQLKGENL